MKNTDSEMDQRLGYKFLVPDPKAGVFIDRYISNMYRILILYCIDCMKS